MTTSSALRARLLRAAVLAAVLVPLSGCVSFEMGRIKRDLARDIEAQSEAEVGGGFAMGFGRISLGLARFSTWVAAPSSTRAARHLTRHVHSVKVGVWPVRGAFDAERLAAPPSMERRGWTPFVVVRDSAAATWVYLRERRDGRLTGMLTAVVADDALVLTKMTGDLSGLVLDAVELGRTEGVLGDALRQAGLVQDDPDGGAPAPPTPAAVRAAYESGVAERAGGGASGGG